MTGIGRMVVHHAHFIFLLRDTISAAGALFPLEMQMAAPRNGSNQAG